MKSTCARLLVFFFFVCPLAEARVDIAHWTAPSGARVFFVETHVLPIVDIQIDFPAGASQDPPGQAGLASMTRALLDKGAEDLDETTLAARLADLGAILGGGVDKDRASITLRTLVEEKTRNPALEIMEKVIGAPRFPEEVLQREKARSTALLKEALTRPDTIAQRAFWSALYPSHPYGRLLTPESLDGLRRADLQHFHARHYSANQASVTIVGDISPDEAKALAQRLTARLPVNPPADAIAAPEPPTSAVYPIAHPASQAHILIGLPALRRGDPDFFPLVVGNYVLGGGGFVSRLMQEIRIRQGFAYSVYSGLTPMKQPGPFQIGLQTKKEQANDALKSTRQVLADFLDKGPDNAELEAAKQNLTGSFPLRLDSNQKILANVAMMGFYGLPLDYLDTYANNIQKVTREEVLAAFSRHIKPESLVTVVVAGN